MWFLFASQSSKGKQMKVRHKKFQMKAVIPVIILAAAVSIVLAVGLGPVSVPPEITWKVILSKLPVIGERTAVVWEPLQENIVWNLRLPRVLLGMIVGASLAVTGVAMQALVRNQLADPFILGVSSGASAFATLGMLFGVFRFLGNYSLAISAFLGAAVTIILVYLLSRVKGRINITQLLLSGVAISMIMEGLTKVITLSAPNALGLHNAEFWMAGSLASAKWDYLTLPLIIMLLGTSFLMLNYRKLNILLLGDDAAGSLGINTGRIQRYLILISSLLAGVTIAVSGSIGFIGLMCPHVARLIVGSDHKKVLPVSVVLGGIFVVWTDVAARMLIAPEELPVGVLTAIVGGPFFIVLLKRNHKN